MTYMTSSTFFIHFPIPIFLLASLSHPSCHPTFPPPTFAAVSILSPTASSVSPSDANEANRNSSVKAQGLGLHSQLSSKAKPSNGDVTTAARAK